MKNDNKQLKNWPPKSLDANNYISEIVNLINNKENDNSPLLI